MTYEDIRYESRDNVATITINRPEVRNAVRPKTYEELTHAMHAAANDETIGVVVLTGEGDKAFCSGGDVRDQSKRVPNVGRTHMRRLFALLLGDADDGQTDHREGSRLLRWRR